MKKLFLLLVVFVVAIWLILLYGKQSNTLPPESVSTGRLAAGPYEVVMEQTVLVDSSRSTAVNNDYEGANERRFPFFVWYPKTAQPGHHPLIIYSHGFMSHGRGMQYLAEYLASHGFVVGSATYPLTNFSAPGGPNAQDVVNQGIDVRFFIDSLLQRNQSQEDSLYQKIDSSRIAVAGLSLGGMTSKLAAYHPDYFDARIKAVVSIAGPSSMFSEVFFKHRNIPFLMIASPQDAIVPYAENAADILRRVNNAALVSINNASHVGFADTAKWMYWLDNPDSLGCYSIKRNLDIDEAQSWVDQLGSPESGIVSPEDPPLCELDPLPQTMHPVHQHQLTSLIVGSFLQCQFADQAKQKTAACNYFYTDLAGELNELQLTIANQ